MSKYIPGNQKHLTLNDRIYIEESLEQGRSFKDIARYLCKDCISKAGNTHLRRLLIEASKGLCKGAIGYKSKALRARQSGQVLQDDPAWKEDQRSSCCCSKGTCLLYLGHDDRKYQYRLQGDYISSGWRSRVK